MAKPQLVRAVVIPGTAAHFRALMRRLANRCQRIWVSSNGERLIFHEMWQMRAELVAVDPGGRREYLGGHPVTVAGPQRYYRNVDITPKAMTSWAVCVLPPGGGKVSLRAGVEAYEALDGQHIQIDFLDGHSPWWPACRATPIGPAFVEFCEMVLREVEASQGGEEPSPELPKKRGPTLKTQELATAFKRLKDAHPRWSQYRVAQEAAKELNQAITAETVRNTYRQMGWQWERADRIR